MDILHDNSRRTWMELGTRYGELIPDYVLDSDWPTKEAADLGDAYFADAGKRLFPLDSPAAVWLSAAYFTKNANALHYKPVVAEFVLQRIKDAAAVFGIQHDVDKIMQAMGAEKQAEDGETDDNYGWVMRDAQTGAVVGRKYPMFDARGVKLASDYFAEYRGRYPLEIRRHVAQRIMQKAAQYGVENRELAPAVLREAGFGIPRKDVLMSEVLERAHLAKDAEASMALAKVNLELGSCTDEALAAELPKLAEVLDSFDRAAGLTQYYNRRILMPADFLFDIDLKVASDFAADAIELGSHVFSLSKLAVLQPSVFEPVLGEDFVKRTTDAAGKFDAVKLADELHSLPVPDKAALEEHLARSFA